MFRKGIVAQNDNLRRFQYPGLQIQDRILNQIRTSPGDELVEAIDTADDQAPGALESFFGIVRVTRRNELVIHSSDNNGGGLMQGSGSASQFSAISKGYISSLLHTQSLESPHLTGGNSAA